MKTIPDAIDDIIHYVRRAMDYYYRLFESVGSKMNVYGWNGRWKNRRIGTGYARSRRKD
jgi:hypothetical protein